MQIADKIQQCIQNLPSSLQEEALDFVKYLLAKANREAARREATEWNEFSLQFAMQGMEEEEVPDYTVQDLKEVFL